jgi:hypothetical protein
VYSSPAVREAGPLETGILMSRTRSINRQPAINTSLRKTIFLFIFALTFGAGARAQDPACKSIPSGQEFWIRLTEPVSTYSSKLGARVAAMLIESPRCGDAPAFSTGFRSANRRPEFSFRKDRD